MIQNRMRSSSNENLPLGILFSVLSSLFFACMSLCVGASGDVPFVQKTIFRNAVAFIIAAATLLAKVRKDRTVLKFEKGGLKFLILRSVFGSIGIFGNFYALSHLNISDAAILNKMSPFFSIIGSILFLGEVIRPLQALCLFAAFGGALLVIKPGMDFIHLAPSLAGFASGIGAGFAYASVRKCHSYKVDGTLIIAFFSLFSTLLALPYTVANFSPMTATQTLLLTGAGIAAAGGQFAITKAYFCCPASKISIYEYTNVIFAAILGFIFLGQKPDWMSFLGYGIIISAAVGIFFYNRKLSVRPQTRNQEPGQQPSESSQCQDGQTQG